MYKIDGDRIILDKMPRELTDDERLVIATKLSEEIKEFPYYKVTDEEVYEIVNKLDRLYTEKIDKVGSIYQNQIGIKLINSFHPHMWAVKCRHFRTTHDIFENKKWFIHAIEKFIKIRDEQRVFTHMDKLTILKTSSGAQAVSNFRPSVAKYIYDKYAGGGTVLDPCMGYGGRLLGAWCSNIKRYVGVDPCNPTIVGNKNLKVKLIENESYNKTIFYTNNRPDIEICQSPFEDFITKIDNFDLVFTSPPYFNTEKYSNEETQSWKRYQSIDIWYEKFLKVLIEKSYNYLKDDGYFILNVSPAMKDDTIRIANEIFKSEPEVKNMILSLLPVRANTSSREEKVEPIIIYNKSGISNIKKINKQVKFG